MNDIMFRVCQLILIHFIILTEVVTATFLYGELEEEIYMESPPGMRDTKTDDYIILGKCIYDLILAAREYCKKAVEILKNVALTGGNAG